jgi:F0F1-type ATP synthase assembly protein I
MGIIVDGISGAFVALYVGDSFILGMAVGAVIGAIIDPFTYSKKPGA